MKKFKYLKISGTKKLRFIDNYYKKNLYIVFLPGLNHSDNVGATITPQHLLYNRNHMLVGGIRPHLFCLPVLKRDTHQQALISAATSGSHKIFLGTDSPNVVR